MTELKRLISMTCFLMMMIGLQTFEASGQDHPQNIQGSLQVAGAPANGIYDVEVWLFTVGVGGVDLGSRHFYGTQVTNGIFSLTGNFTQAFPSPLTEQWVEFRVKPAGVGGAFTTLTPRQRITYAPLAVKAVTAVDAQNLNGVQASQYVQTSDPRMSDARTPLAGSGSYLQNTSVAQPNSNFNVDGNGTVGGTLSALVLSVTGGITADNINVNSPLGYKIGGVTALKMTANGSTAVGNQAGLLSSGEGNSFYGQTAGRQSFAGSNNSFFGAAAGYLNDAGNDNSFFGYLSGNNSQGSRNSFFGLRAGLGNGAGNDNTLVGYNSQTIGTLNNATAIGSRSQVNQSNSLILGSINGVNGATADTNVGIGTTTPANKLHVNGNVRVTNGAIYITNPNTLIITSPNGACWGITVNNSGGLATFPVTPCP